MTFPGSRHVSSSSRFKMPKPRGHHNDNSNPRCQEKMKGHSEDALARCKVEASSYCNLTRVGIRSIIYGTMRPMNFTLDFMPIFGSILPVTRHINQPATVHSPPEGTCMRSISTVFCLNIMRIRYTIGTSAITCGLQPGSPVYSRGPGWALPLFYGKPALYIKLRGW